MACCKDYNQIWKSSPDGIISKVLQHSYHQSDICRIQLAWVGTGQSGVSEQDLRIQRLKYSKFSVATNLKGCI